MTTAANNKNLLVLGSMDEFVQLVKRAQERGCRVIVADGYEDGPARAFADATYVIPITDAQALAALCAEEQVDALITSFSDVLFEAGSHASAAAGLPVRCSLDALECLRNKEAMKAMFTQLDIPFARSVVTPADQVESACESFAFPCVMKPLDGHGSYGIVIVNSAAEAQDAAARVVSQSSRAAKVVVEEYNTGHEFNMMAWVSEGRVTVVSIADREKTPREAGEVPHVSRIVYPSRFTSQVIREAGDYAQRVATYLNLVDGPLCMQFFWSPEQGVEVCEVAGRVFGYEHELLEYASGLAVEDLLLDTAFDPQALRQRLAAHDAQAMPHVSCGVYFHFHDGVVGTLDQARSVLESPLAVDTLFFCHEGDALRNGRGGKPYAARVFLQSYDRAALDAECARMFAAFQLPDEAGHDLAFANRLPAELEEASNAQ